MRNSPSGRGNTSFSLDDDAQDGDGGAMTPAPAPAAAGANPSYSLTTARSIDMDSGVAFGGTMVEEGDLGNAQRAIRGLASAEPEAMEAGRALLTTTSTFGAGISSASTQSLLTNDNMSAMELQSPEDSMSEQELRNTLKALRQAGKEKVLHGLRLAGRTSAFPAPLPPASQAVGKPVSIDQELAEEVVDPAIAARITGGPAEYAEYARQQQALPGSNTMRLGHVGDLQRALQQSQAAANSSSPASASAPGSNPMPTDATAQMLALLTTMMSTQGASSSKSSRSKTISKMLSDFSEEAVKLGGDGVSDLTRWISLTRETAGTLTSERQFMTKVRTLMVNETAKDFDSGTRDIDGRGRSGAGTDYLAKFLTTTNKRSYRDIRRAVEVQYKQWKTFEDETGPPDSMAMMQALGNPTALAALTAAQRNPFPKPDYACCFDEFCRLLTQQDYILTSEQHRWAFPPLNDTDLIWRPGRPGRPPSQGGKKKATAAIAPDTWETYNDRWDKRALKVQETPYGDLNQFEGTTSVHLRYEMLPPAIRNHVTCTPGAYPQRPEDWTLAFLEKTIKPFIDSGGLKEVVKMSHLEKKMKQTIAAVNAVKTHSVSSSGGSKKGTAKVTSVTINGKTYPFADNKYSKA